MASRVFFRERRSWLMPLALLYAALMILYGCSWIYMVQGVHVELGFDGHYEAAFHTMLVDSVEAGSPAERAGLRAGDRIVAIDGASLVSAQTQPEVWATHRPGDKVRLTIERRGEATPRTLTGVFRRIPDLGADILSVFPVPYTLVGIIVLLLRPTSPIVWLLALLFGGFAAVPGPPSSGTYELLPSTLRAVVIPYQQLMVSVVGPLFYIFFSVFPVRSPLDRRVPWLKPVAAVLGLAMGVAGLPHHALELPPPFPGLIGQENAQRVAVWFQVLFVALGMVSLLLNRVVTRDTQVRRKIRVVFWGTLVGVGPSLVLLIVRQSLGYQSPLWLGPLWLDLICDVFLMALFPLSFAYAILRHRVLDIPVLLRRSARYMLVQRGFDVLLGGASACLTVLFALTFNRYLVPSLPSRGPASVGLGVAFGGLLLWGGTRVHRHVGTRIDRAFFRSAYDARQILEDLARRSAAATNRIELVRMLESHLTEALHPGALLVLLRSTDDRLLPASRPGSSGAAPAGVVTAELEELARRGQCWEASLGGADAPLRGSGLESLQPECVVPLTGRGRRLIGVIVLGPRLSEETYSGEDKRLLLSVASQAGTALDNIRLAEEIAEKMEVERRAASEIAIARDVQLRLLPQSLPRLEHLELTARCIQARSVGGDYYDFLDLGPQQLGIVLADVSGKGIQAALLMASLQAHLRSQSGNLSQDTQAALRHVNRLLWSSTDPAHFATLFLGVYADATRHVSYINCGHNAPLRLRLDGSQERLTATATVLGAFEDWDCSLGSTQLDAGDLLVVYSDGITEASCGDDQFGEERLVRVVRDNAHRPVDDIALAIIAGVQEFEGSDQSDDLTLLIARAR